MYRHHEIHYLVGAGAVSPRTGDAILLKVGGYMLDNRNSTSNYLADSTFYETRT